MDVEQKNLAYSLAGVLYYVSWFLCLSGFVSLAEVLLQRCLQFFLGDKLFVIFKASQMSTNSLIPGQLLQQ